MSNSLILRWEWSNQSYTLDTCKEKILVVLWYIFRLTWIICQVESTSAALGMKITILKEKKTQAFKINEEYLQQVELLKALYAELRRPNHWNLDYHIFVSEYQ